jgi:uncharacterized protein (TIGR02646 family)
MASEAERAAKFFRQPRRKRSQRVFDWQPVLRLWSGAKDELVAPFHGKCAYCEMRLSEDGFVGPYGLLNYFRPVTGALNRSGTLAADHYWWLGFQWTNIVACCQGCSSSKGRRFPVKRRRAEVGLIGGPLFEAEERLLLDPCSDDPETHLLFSEDGTVSSRSEIGRTTIQVLSLNRSALVARRHAHFANVRGSLERIKLMPDRTCQPRGLRTINRWTGVQAEFAAATRQLVAIWVLDNLVILPEKKTQLRRIVERFLGKEESEPETPSLPRVSRSEIQAAETDFREHSKVREAHSVERKTKAAQSAYFAGARRIERVEIHNFRSIRHFAFDMPRPTEGESWMMLIGENGTGKSSVLQAIALALIGQKHVNRLGLDARQFLNHHRANKEDEGFVRIHLTNITEPIELRFGKTSSHFTVTPRSELILLFGYGPIRLLPRSATTRGKHTRYVRVKNLFDPYARLQDAERWLTNQSELPNRRFGAVARSLKRLLLLEQSGEIHRRGQRLVIRVNQERHSLDEMSDGYQSVVALATDIMQGLDKWQDVRDAEGVVLIDELEAHLHPRWKMEIVARLRRVFPKLMFIVTTHDPLCLRGLKPGEIAVAENGDSGVTLQIVRESIAHLRADQLLTSPLFGLGSTKDNEAVRLTALDGDRYDELFLKRERTPEEASEFELLRARIIHNTASGETPADRFVERAVREALDHLSKEHPTPSILLPKPSAEAAQVALRAKFAALLK